ncbi:MAG: hypothetical protein C0483_24880 [Pirellula sp.]|nr:hypothetical protein [Pirellula sp.]
MPRALVLCEYATLNGGERSLLAVLPHLQGAGWEFDFLAPQDGALANALRERAIAIVGRHDALADVVSRRHYGLLHANSLAMSLYLGVQTSTLGVPTIGHLRDIVKLSATKIAQLNQNTRLLAVSEAVRAHHVAQGLDAARTHVLHNGIDTTIFFPTPLAGETVFSRPSPLAGEAVFSRPSPLAGEAVFTRPSPLAGEGQGVRGKPDHHLRTELQLPSNVKLIGIIGQIILRKGQDTALTAVAPLLQGDPNLHLAILGERHSEKPETVEYELKLHAIAAEAGIADRVHYLGTRSDVPRILPQFTLLLHMARQEPLGRVLLESAACGVPVVATDVGGTREIFPHAADDGALLVPVDDVVAARTAVQSILADAALARRMGSAGRRRIEAAFSVEQSAAGLLRHYKEVLASVEP